MTPFKRFAASFLITFSVLLVGCSNQSSKEATPVLFETKAEAEKAAKKFNCKGAHKMGDKWMPCEIHREHEDNKKNSGHGLHHHHH